MRWINDTSGRFPQRPFFEREELDYECEKIVTSFVEEKYGTVTYPISTNDLTILVEQYASDLDLYADLSDEGYEVEGVTDFFPASKPRIRIASSLQELHMENRLRSTLAHELGHVKFHDALWPHHQLPLFSTEQQDHSPRCKRETIIGTKNVDWMEWQAGYASGALLMPITPLTQTTQFFFERAQTIGPLLADSHLGQHLIRIIKVKFQVSIDAARVRLLQLGYLSEHTPSTSLLTNF